MPPAFASFSKFTGLPSFFSSISPTPYSACTDYTHTQQFRFYYQPFPDNQHQQLQYRLLNSLRRLLCQRTNLPYLQLFPQLVFAPPKSIPIYTSLSLFMQIPLPLYSIDSRGKFINIIYLPAVPHILAAYLKGCSIKTPLLFHDCLQMHSERLHLRRQRQFELL